MNRKTVILIQPKETDIDLVVNRPYLPLALLSVSRYLHPEYEIVIIDQRVEKKWQEKLSSALQKDVICVGVSCLLGNQIEYSLQVSRFVKAHSSAPVLWGGIHNPVLIRQALSEPCIDGVIQGEGEETFREVVTRLSRGEQLMDISGYWSKSSIGEQSGGPGQFLDQDNFPELPYKLIDMRNYAKYRGGSFAVPLETSRGCNARCNFCACSYYSSAWRGMSADTVISRIRYIRDILQIRTILIIDDNFFGDIQRAKTIFQRLRDEKVPVKLDIQGMRIDAVQQLSDDDLHIMFQAGVTKVNIGVESGSPRVLRFINKGITVEQVIAQNRRLARFGLWVQYNFITGYPTETPREIRQTTALAMKLTKENTKALINYFCIYTPLPGTKLFEFEEERGVVFPRTLEEWSGYDRIFGSTRNKIEINKKLNILSLFVDRKVSYYTKSVPLRLLTSIYRPLARLRMKHLFLTGFLEGAIFMGINRLQFKTRSLDTAGK